MNNFNNLQSKLQLFWSATWIDWVNLKGFRAKLPVCNLPPSSNRVNWGGGQIIPMTFLFAPLDFRPCHWPCKGSLQTITKVYWLSNHIPPCSHMYITIMTFAYLVATNLLSSNCTFQRILTTKVITEEEEFWRNNYVPAYIYWF